MKYLIILLKVIVLGLLIAAQMSKSVWKERLSAPLANFTFVLLDFLVFAFAANLLIVLLSAFYRKQKQVPKGSADNVIRGLENIYYILLTGAVIMTVLGFWGIDYARLFTSLSIVAAAIAILAKDFIAEIISGIIISFSREVHIGDYLKIGDYKGKITDINFTKIALLNEDDDVIFIPNSTVFSSEIINYTKKGIRRVNIEFEINIQHLKTIEALEADLIETLSDYHKHIEKNSFALRTVTISKDSLELKFQYVLHRIDRDLEREIRRKTVRRVVNYVKAHLSASTPDARN
ncbi:MAG: mechanosensitive ion channel family protein [Saprospiraceae bacterium]|nr:mechanosensitive ion channel family protein [Saprospiraceae bacterium]